jgi:hypothetical protein
MTAALMEAEVFALESDGATEGLIKEQGFKYLGFLQLWYINHMNIKETLTASFHSRITLVLMTYLYIINKITMFNIRGLFGK